MSEPWPKWGFRLEPIAGSLSRKWWLRWHWVTGVIDGDRPYVASRFQLSCGPQPSTNWVAPARLQRFEFEPYRGDWTTPSEGYMYELIPWRKPPPDPFHGYSWEVCTDCLLNAGGEP